MNIDRNNFFKNWPLCFTLLKSSHIDQIDRIVFSADQKKNTGNKIFSDELIETESKIYILKNVFLKESSSPCPKAIGQMRKNLAFFGPSSVKWT